VEATNQQTLADTLVNHESLAPGDLINTLLMYLTLLSEVSEEEALDEYTLIKPALFRLYQEDQIAFTMVAKKIKKQLGFPIASIREDIGKMDLARTVNGGTAPHVNPATLSQATRLVGLVADAELWHTPECDGYATITVNGHQEHWSLTSKNFRRWLRSRYYEETKAAPGSQAVQDALGVLEAKALFEGPEYLVFVRVTEHEGAIYIDLANNSWQAVKITSDGWDVVDDPPVKFRRPRGIQALPHPVKGGTIKALHKFVSIVDEDAWALLLAWLIMAFRPTGPYPLLILHGGQGTAKSTLARLLKSLIDPNEAPLRAEPREGRDLMVAADNSWVLAYDNLSHLPLWLSDALCRLATGGGFTTRELYSNREEAIFNSQRPVILTGIEELATRGDLLDRGVILYLPEIPENERKTEKKFWAHFKPAWPLILGALFDAVSATLGRVESVKLPYFPRMADFAQWGVAAERALGLKRGAFMRAYTENREAANSLALEDSPVGAAVCRMLENIDKWEGTASQLLVKLTDESMLGLKKDRKWPGNGQALSNVLRRLASNLRKVGVAVWFFRSKDKARIRMIDISHVTDPQQQRTRRRTQTRDGAGASDTRASTRKTSKNNHMDAADGADANLRPHSNGKEGNSPDAPTGDTPSGNMGNGKPQEKTPPSQEGLGNLASAASAASTAATFHDNGVDANGNGSSAVSSVASAAEASDPEADRLAAEERMALQEEATLTDDGDVLFEIEEEMA
jgi:hypothetical protein